MEDVEEVKSEDEDIFYVKNRLDKKQSIQYLKRSQINFSDESESVRESDTT